MSERNEIESVINALRVDVNDYPIEPFDLFQLLNSILFVLDENRPAHHTDLDRINRTWKAAADALTTALAAKDTETNGHAERVVRFSLRLGRQLRLSPQQMIELELGSRLHDIGKIGVPDAILRKPAPLNEAEWLLMREHPRCGEEMVRASNLPEGVAQLVGQHHEHWNGCGYPRKLSGNDISILARIFSVIDTFDAITSDRVYRAARPYKEARRRISEVAGTQFDPVIVTAFLSIDESEWEQIRAECSHKDCPKTLSSAVS
jgi:HD-GYP domain-containing protein (c-di-GMP phosphodiesterase class II)